MTERRQINRWQADKETKIKLEGAEVSAKCHLKDINLKGAQISLAMRLPKDTFLKLSLFLTEDSILNVEAWVAWQRTIDGHYVYGIYFSRINDADKEKIYQFIRRYFPEQLTQQWWQGLEKGGETMQKEKFEDRRVFERFPANFGLRYLDVSSHSEGRAQLRDISAKGIGMVTNATLTIRAPLEMWLEVPDNGEPFYSRGEVVWSKPVSANEYQVGVNLEKADLVGLSRITKILILR